MQYLALACDYDGTLAKDGKESVMVLPTGVNKGTGLAAALHGLMLSPRNVVGIGDAENDHSFLNLCGCSVAVSNALPPRSKSRPITQHVRLMETV
jgi:hydroxymethylpyrimidine pyrophosphatase-like HAD family hydrolase